MISKTKISFNSELFAAAWNKWDHKGYQPIHNLRIFKSLSENQTFYSVGLLDYQTRKNYYFPSLSVFATYESAFAELGRALDKTVSAANYTL